MGHERCFRRLTIVWYIDRRTHRCSTLLTKRRSTKNSVGVQFNWLPSNGPSIVSDAKPQDYILQEGHIFTYCAKIMPQSNQVCGPHIVVPHCRQNEPDARFCLVGRSRLEIRLELDAGWVGFGQRDQNINSFKHRFLTTNSRKPSWRGKSNRTVASRTRDGYLPSRLREGCTRFAREQRTTAGVLAKARTACIDRCTCEWRHAHFSSISMRWPLSPPSEVLHTGIHKSTAGHENGVDTRTRGRRQWSLLFHASSHDRCRRGA